MNYLHPDAGLAAVIDFVREAHAPVDEAITVGAKPLTYDVALLTGAVTALLNAIDTRLPGSTTANQAVAA